MDALAKILLLSFLCSHNEYWPIDLHRLDGLRLCICVIIMSVFSSLLHVQSVQQILGTVDMVTYDW